MYVVLLCYLQLDNLFWNFLDNIIKEELLWTCKCGRMLIDL